MASNGQSGQAGDRNIIINYGDHAANAAGDHATATVNHVESPAGLKQWQEEMEKRIEAQAGLLPDDKTDLKTNVTGILKEISKGKQADPGRLERLLNTIGSMAPDILEVAIATLANPLLGLGLVAKKVSDRARVELQAAA
jgi:hypothetical protein